MVPVFNLSKLVVLVMYSARAHVTLLFLFTAQPSEMDKLAQETEKLDRMLTFYIVHVFHSLQQ